MKLYRLDWVEGEHFSVKVNVRHERTRQAVDVHFMPVACVDEDCLRIFHGVRLMSESPLTFTPISITPDDSMSELESSLVSFLDLEYLKEGVWRSHTSSRSVASRLDYYLRGVESYTLHKELWDPEKAVLRLVQAHLRFTHLLMNTATLFYRYMDMDQVDMVMDRVDEEMRCYSPGVQVAGDTFLGSYPVNVVDSLSMVRYMIAELLAVRRVDVSMLGDV